MALLYVLLGALVVGAVAFGVVVLITGVDPGLASAESDGSEVPLPTDRPLTERDFVALRFDTGLRGYRMAEVDTALRRAAYDVGYKEELIAVLEAEVSALRAGRLDEADALQRARLAALGAEKTPDSHEPTPAAGSAPPPAVGSAPPPAAPAESRSARPSEPAGPAAAGSWPAGTTPAGTTPAGTTPAGTTPAGTTPARTTPARTTPARPAQDGRAGDGAAVSLGKPK
jgi:DivIVA domain-containing protein